MRIRLKSAIYFPIVVLLGLLAHGCGGSSGGGGGGGDLKLLGAVAAKPVNAPFRLTISDATTGGFPSAPVTITVTGSDASSVMKSDGTLANTPFSVTGGVVNLSVEEAVALPVKFTLMANAEGYLTTSINVELTSTGDSRALSMVSLAKPPTGTEVATDTSGSVDGSGTTVAAIAVNTPAEANTGGSTSVTIPAGTTITSKDGTLLSGNLTVDVVYHSNSSIESLSSFPGGFTTQVMVPDPSNPGSFIPQEGNFISGGFVSVEVTDENGTKGEQFSNPLDFTATIPAAGLINPETGSAVQAGETITIWSYDTATGVWTDEGLATIVVDGSGLSASFQSSHLSYFNMDWHYSPVCAPRLELTGATGVGLDVAIDIVGHTSRSTHVTDGFIQLYNIPMDYPLTFTARHKGAVVGTLDTTGIPSDGSCPTAYPYQTVANPYVLTMSGITFPAPEETASVTISIVPADCSLFTLQVPQNTYLYYREAGVSASWNSWKPMPISFATDGTATMSVEVQSGGDYDFYYSTWGSFDHALLSEPLWFSHSGTKTLSVPDVTSKTYTYNLSDMCTEVENRINL